MKKLIIFQDDECSMRHACKALEGKWKIPVIYVLCVNGTLRYGQLKQALGITNVMLSNTLKDLEQDGLVTRTSYNEIPPRVDYSLSNMAMDLIPILLAFSKWGEKVMEYEHAHSCPFDDETDHECS
ncbi:winged helix-turn-helix transcriptional regulator [Allobaculum mucilyticum]|uniref:winged helix-turn-helix transcriptional regulator n=1 Tax=Allobaculum mucilyticum TaxID=2834459 RepID=UPI001E38B3C3|nr:helix-turn-helix domain-containing protein [Allobaculum mucilyticum]UNT97243.1 helix-turn-helix transcriptional regulator [Allobaculum mucilyticum]